MDEPKSEQREDSLGFERLIFFSDAVFAIAITLLVLEIRVPELAPQNLAELPERVFELWPKILSYVVSFLVIAAYWQSHHRMFRYIKRYDHRLMQLNILLLMFVAFIPFPTALLGEYGDLQFPAIFYAGILVVVGLLYIALWRHATIHHRLVSPDLDPKIIRYSTARSLSTVVIFLVSIPISFINPTIATLCWGLVFFTNQFLPRAMHITDDS